MTPTVNFKTKTKTKFWKDPTCAIFLKSWEFKYIKYDTHASSAHHQCIISASSVYHQCIIISALSQSFALFTLSSFILWIIMGNTVEQYAYLAMALPKPEGAWLVSHNLPPGTACMVATVGGNWNMPLYLPWNWFLVCLCKRKRKPASGQILTDEVMKMFHLNPVCIRHLCTRQAEYIH